MASGSVVLDFGQVSFLTSVWLRLRGWKLCSRPESGRANFSYGRDVWMKACKGGRQYAFGRSYATIGGGILMTGPAAQTEFNRFWLQYAVARGVICDQEEKRSVNWVKG